MSKTTPENWRDYQARLREGKAEPDFPVGLAATFTANPLVPHIGARLLAAGLLPQIEVGPFDQLFQVCLDPGAHFKKGCQAIVLLWRFEDLVLGELLAFLAGEGAALDRALEKVDFLLSAIGGLRERFPGALVVGLPPFPAGLPAAALALEGPGPHGLAHAHRVLSAHCAARLGAIPGVRLADLDAAQRQAGLPASFDARQWYLYRQPFGMAFLREAGGLCGRLLAAARRPPRKCIVVDCDNTLWGGVVGEDGVGGIEVGDDFPGSAFRDFQRWLLHQRSRGVLLAIASKNNEADVLEVFAKHSGMILRREHFSAARIDWNPKPENIVHLARELNIGVDSLVFIDDSPMEIAFMEEARPEVLSFRLPEDPADILEAVRGIEALDRLESTAEDRNRAEMMRAERRREEAGAALGAGEFVAALELRIDLFRARPEDHDRIAQLINKTNQFNLTTVRRTVDEVRALAASPAHLVYGLKVADKFGDYGLTGAVVVERRPEEGAWVVDTLLLSCRVLGRGVETSLLKALAAEARTEAARKIVASYVPTPKNGPAASYLSGHGFVPLEGAAWEIEIDRI